MTAQEAYKEFEKRCRELAVIQSSAAVLGWEERTYMPPNGAGLRAEQLSYMSGLFHEKFTDPKFGELLSTVEASDMMKDPESPEAVNIRETRRMYDKQTKLPRELVEELTKTTTLAQGEWVKARKASDFKAFLPWLEKVVKLLKQKAEAYGYEGEPYNALLDDYEPGATVDDVATVFEQLRNDLVDLLGRIKDAKKKPDQGIVNRAFDVDRQKVFGEMVSAAFGFDFQSGRLDITAHPFCSGFGPGDTRITTRYNPNRLTDALFGIMHETGHALYEMGLNKDKYFGLPMGESISLGIHESQSRMWENQVGRSRPFWEYSLPQAKRIFREALEGVSLDDFYGAINYVTPSFIRVEADEATYNLHILLRFELERAIMNDDIPLKDVADEWRKRFKKYFGIEVDNDANGCLQDVHWSAGYIGYFPTYTLGNLYAAQFFAKAKEELPGLEEDIAGGYTGRLLDWLREKIHQQGQRYRATKLCEKVTGKPLSHKPLVDYMNRKFGEIYGI
ncbi:MAG: carboxypeptidase M32 [Candidatus Zixiibacteriota bacterium]|nr:MAG: carboxypeptidase M32 [candidate division Zixibacteria bacterium]